MSTALRTHAKPAPGAMLADAIPDAQWDVFTSGTEALTTAGVPFLVHGALALATYTGRWRNTKDVDIIVMPRDRERAIAALKRAGFADYFEQEAYDRSWIFRGIKADVLFDTIWDLPNHRVEIDAAWFERAVDLQLRGRHFASVPAEELVRVKLYVLQRERCDWVDVLNVLGGAVERIDWRWLVARMGRDGPLLHPSWLREHFALPYVEVEDPAAAEVRRVKLFDSRPWFALHQPVDRPLER
jgi:hypothetical protein